MSCFSIVICYLAFYPPEIVYQWNWVFSGRAVWLARFRTLHWKRVFGARAAWRVTLRRLRLRFGRDFLRLRDHLPGTFRCSICMEDYRTKNAIRFTPCRHPFCKDCARGYVLSKLEDRQLPILCPLCATETERPAARIGGRYFTRPYFSVFKSSAHFLSVSPRWHPAQAPQFI